MTRRIEALTPLRFVAAAAVLVHHLVFVPRVAAAGVSFFFVLSGFVLTWSYGSHTGAGTFYGRRFARLFPLHLLTWVGAVVLLAVTGPAQPAVGLAAALLLVQAWVPDQQVFFAANGPSWSLSCEAFFYAVLPMVVRPVCRLRPTALATVGLVVLSALAAGNQYGAHLSPAAGFWFRYTFPPYRLLEFLLGVLLAAAMLRGLRVAVPPVLAVGAFLAAMWASAHVSSWHPHGVPVPVGLSVQLGMLLVVGSVTTACLEGRTRLLEHPLAVRLGDWSFALYISHLVALHVLLARLGDPGDKYWGRSHPGQAAVFAVVAVAIAGVLHVAVERPANHRLRTLLARRRPVPAGRQVPVADAA